MPDFTTLSTLYICGNACDMVAEDLVGVILERSARRRCSRAKLAHGAIRAMSCNQAEIIELSRLMKRRALPNAAQAACCERRERH